MLAANGNSAAAAKRKRSDSECKENDKRFVSVTYKNRTHKVTWFEGTSGDEIERHIRKKLLLPENAGQLFLHDPNNEDMDVVISKSLPSGSAYNATVLAPAALPGAEAEVAPGTPRPGNFKQADLHSDVRISKISPLVPPALLLEDLPCTPGIQAHVRAARHACANIVNGRDDRLIVVVGPCSIHDPAAALDYARRLVKLAAEVQEELFVVMRVYFEKPRTTVGWKGLINDPDLDETFHINKGLRLARQTLLDINGLGLPCGCEFLDTISPQYTADLVSWGAIGARTTESQLHRELTSGLSMPIGFKNSTSGDIKVAMDACKSSAHRHCFLGITSQGLTAIVQTAGNPDCHIILRGGSAAPNYDAASVAKIEGQIEQSKQSIKIMIDCSHANSRKIHTNQPVVLADVGAQVAAGSRSVMGVMVESNLVAGAQKLGGGALVYGKSITDACVAWDTTVEMLKALAADVRTRRQEQVVHSPIRGRQQAK